LGILHENIGHEQHEKKENTTMNQPTLTEGRVISPAKVSPLIALGTIVLAIAAAVFIYTGNMTSLHRNLLTSGTAADKNSSAQTWFIMGTSQAASAAGMAVGFGLVAGGVASTICAASRR
jgi:hypothetical protein